MRVIACLAILLSLSCAGCSVAGGLIGGTTAASVNRDHELRRARGENVPDDADANTGARIAVGVAVGLALDALFVYSMIHSLDKVCFTDDCPPP